MTYVSNHLFRYLYQKRIQRNLQGTIWPWNRDIEPTWTSGSWAQSNLYRFFWKRQPLQCRSWRGKRRNRKFYSWFSAAQSRRWRGSTTLLCLCRWQASTGLWSQLSQRSSSRISARGRWAFVLCRSRHPPRKWSSCQSSKSTYPLCRPYARSVLNHVWPRNW